MALSHSPQIVTNGLILALDAANTKSYPGSGTTWTDVSGNGYKGTLNGNIVYYTTASGLLSFGTSSTTTDYISFSKVPGIASATGLTVEVWGKFNTYSGSGGAGTYYVCGATPSVFRLMYGGNGFSWAMSTVNVGWYGPGTTLSISSGVTIGNWNQTVFVYNGSNVSVYLNGVFKSITSTSISGALTSTISTFTISNTDAANVSFAVGSIASVKLYNRALSANEINQNFNAYRGRYGL